MKELLIHQSLHGYSEGHRLLECSIKLPDEIARLMLRMSDLSGSSVFPGFEEYYSGYPIAPLKLYVFAKTWYAGEMPRPGCVWTHSLILQSQDFEAIASLEQLTKLFARPKLLKSESNAPKFSREFAGSIRFLPDAENVGYNGTENHLLPQLEMLVKALYADKKRNILVPAPNSSFFESSLFKIWSQQWPELRGSFSFCTGALSARGFAGRPFDIQFAPHQLIREITTSVIARQSQELNVLSREEPGTEEMWVYETVKDANLSFGGRFRRALWSLADGSGLEDFGGFARLVLLFITSNSVSLQDLIPLVAQQFPKKESAASLKCSLFGENRATDLGFNFCEWELLSELSISTVYSAFDSASLNLRGRAMRLCSENPDDAKQLISILFKGPVNTLGEDVLAGLLEAINPDIARKLTKQQPHFLPTLFRAKPELGASADLWRAAGDHVRELFESLSSSENLTEDTIAKISEAIISSGSETLVRRALDKWGKAAVFGILNYVESSGNGLSERVVQALSFHDRIIMEWLTTHKDCSLFAKVTCAHIVAQYSYNLKDFGTEIWLRTYEELRSESNYAEVNYIASLLLALGLQNVSPTPVKVISLCFEHIYRLAWADRMPDSNWIILDPIVPHLLWLHDWDKCERLRRGLVEAFVKFNWPPEQLSDCVRSDDLLSRIIKSADHVDGGYNYFHRNN